MLKNIAKVSLSALISLSLFSCTNSTPSTSPSTTASTVPTAVKMDVGVVSLAGGGKTAFGVDTAVANTIANTLELTQNIRGIATDSNNNVYFADESEGFVAMVTPEGKLNVISKGLSTPVGLVVNASGDVFVAENGAKKQITKLTKQSNGTYEKKSFPSDSFINLYSLTLSKADPDILYIGDAQNPDIAGDFSVLKQLKISTGTITSLNNLTGVIDTAGIATDAAGNLYIADYAETSANKGKIFKYDVKEQKVSTLVENLTSPDGLVMDKAGNLYVALEGTKIFKYDTALKGTLYAGGGEKGADSNNEKRTDVKIGGLEMIAMTESKTAGGEPTLYYADKEAKLVRKINP